MLNIILYNLLAELTIFYTNIDKINLNKYTPLIWITQKNNNKAINLFFKTKINSSIYISVNISALLYIT